MRPIDDDEDRKTGTHPRCEKAVQRHFEAGLLGRLAAGGLLNGFVVLDETAGKRPVTIARAVVQANEEDAVIAFGEMLP